MIVLEVPEQLISLPNYRLTNSDAARHSVTVNKSRNGRVYTYVKSNTYRTYQWTFELTYTKAEELKSFIHSFADKIWTVRDKDGTVLTGTLKTNPVEFDHFARNPLCIEQVSVTLELELK